MIPCRRRTYGRRLQGFVAIPVNAQSMARLLREAEADFQFAQPTERLSGGSGTFWHAAGPESWVAVAQQADLVYGLPTLRDDELRRFVRAMRPDTWLHIPISGAAEHLASLGLKRRDTRHLVITSGAGAHAQALSEFGILASLFFIKDVPEVLQRQSRREWAVRPFAEVAGRRLVAVGFGEISRRLSGIWTAMGGKVIAVTRDGSCDEPNVEDSLPISRLEEAASRADVLFLALPASPETEKIVSADVIGTLPPQAVVINVGRGSTVDEDALIDALRRRVIAGAGLDVVGKEPLPPHSPLWTLDNVLLTCHAAGLSDRLEEHMLDRFLRNLHRFMAGQPLEHVVVPDG